MEKRRMDKMKKKIIIGAIIVALLSGAVALRLNATKARNVNTVQTITLKKGDLVSSVLVSGTVVSSNSKNVYSSVTNYSVKQVKVKVGDKVKAGDVLAQLDTTSLELDIKQAELNIKSAEESLKNEQTNNKYNLQNARNNVESAKLDLDNAQNNFDDSKKLYDEGKSTSDDLAKAELTLKKAKLAYDNAQASLNNAKGKTTNSSKNNIESQKAALEKQKQTLKKAKITAPMNGTITLVNAKENGSSTGLLFVIEDTDKLIVSTQIGEYDIHSVKVGQDVIIKSDSTGDKESAGVVSKIAPTAVKDANGNTASSSNVQFDAEVTLKDRDPNIKIGMNVRLTIKLDEKKNVFSVPYDALVTESGGSQYIYAIDASQKDSNSQNVVKKIKVEKGMETDMYIEVISPDLKDGMNIESNPKDSTKTTN
jgi:HlyD family secretion protein